MTVSRGNTVLLFCLTVLFICPQPANRASSSNTVRRSPALGAFTNRGGSEEAEMPARVLLVVSLVYRLWRVLFYEGFHGGHWSFTGTEKTTRRA